MLPSIPVLVLCVVTGNPVLSPSFIHKLVTKHCPYKAKGNEPIQYKIRDYQNNDKLLLYYISPELGDQFVLVLIDNKKFPIIPITSIKKSGKLIFVNGLEFKKFHEFSVTILTD